MTEATDNSTSTILMRSLRGLLRPLVRLLIARGIALPLLTETLKGLYVQVAAADFSIPGKRQTDSRISMLTGVHRKDVRRLRGGSEPPDSNAMLSTGIQVVSTWLGDARFLTARGKPRVLPLRGGDDEPSFEALVEQVCRQDIRSRAVLDELMRREMVALDNRQRARLLVDAFVPDNEDDETMVYFGRNVRDHIAAGVHNLEGGEPMLERSVHYTGLTVEDVASLREQTREAAMQLLGESNRTMLSMKTGNTGNEQATRRVNFGVYFYTDELGAPQGEDKE